MPVALNLGAKLKANILRTVYYKQFMKNIFSLQATGIQEFI